MKKSKAIPQKSNATMMNTSTQRILSFFLGFIILSLSIVGSYFFRIDKIECYLEGELETDVCLSLSFLKNKSLFFTNFEQTSLFSTTLINHHGQVYEPVEIKKKLPNQLIIFFQKEDPWYKIKKDQDIFVVNSGGYLALDQEIFKLPTVEAAHDYQDLIDQNKLNQETHLLISNFVFAFDKESLDYDLLFLDHDESRVEINSIVFVFKDHDEPGLVAKKIRLILNNQKQIIDSFESEKSLEKVDLRFDLPVAYPVDSSN